MGFPEVVVFHRPKLGSTEAEWEDGAAYHPAPERTRCVVVDGATEAYDAVRWVGLLTESFVSAEGPPLTPEGLDAWLALVQRRWDEGAPRQFGSIFEERKFRTSGSFATFLGVEVTGLPDGRPVLQAAAIGDAVLFQVRDDRLVQHFPALAGPDFGLDPDGLSTLVTQRPRIRSGLRFWRQPLQVGDRLYLATDAVAAALVRSVEAGGSPWAELGRLQHPSDFDGWAEARLARGELKNDDLTLLRVGLVAVRSDRLLLCGPGSSEVAR